MSAKRTKKPERSCKFCGISLDGRPPKTTFCSSSCRAKYWRADRMIVKTVDSIEKHLNTIFETLASDRHHDQAVDAIEYLMIILMDVQNKGYQRELPGVDGNEQ